VASRAERTGACTYSPHWRGPIVRKSLKRRLAPVLLLVLPFVVAAAGHLEDEESYRRACKRTHYLGFGADARAARVELCHTLETRISAQLKVKYRQRLRNNEQSFSEELISLTDMRCTARFTGIQHVRLRDGSVAVGLCKDKYKQMLRMRRVRFTVDLARKRDARVMEEAFATQGVLLQNLNLWVTSDDSAGFRLFLKCDSDYPCGRAERWKERWGPKAGKAWHARWRGAVSLKLGDEVKTVKVQDAQGHPVVARGRDANEALQNLAGRIAHALGSNERLGGFIDHAIDQAVGAGGDCVCR
jgi:hypothetical protein